VNQPDHLPQCEADLEDWSVYADALLTAGHPRGEWIARDLAVPATPTDEQRATLAEFGQSSRVRGVELVWSLGHIKHLVIAPEQRRPLGRDRIGAPSAASIEYAIELMQRATGRLVEHVEVPAIAIADRASWQRLFAAIPPTCAKLTAYMDRPRTHEVDDLLPLIPAHVRTLVLPTRPFRMHQEQVIRCIASGRFDELDLTDAPWPADALDEIEEAIARSAVRLRVGMFDQRVRHARVVLGGDGEGAIVLRAIRRAVVLPRWAPYELQAVLGVIGIREWLARTHPETYWISPAGDDVRIEPGKFGNCGRRGDAWTCEPLPRGAELVTGDVDRQTRELFA